MEPQCSVPYSQQSFTPPLQQKPTHAVPQFSSKIRCNILPYVFISLKVSPLIYAQPMCMSFSYFPWELHPQSITLKTSSESYRPWSISSRSLFLFMSLPLSSLLIFSNALFSDTSVYGLLFIRAPYKTLNLHTELRSKSPYKAVLKKVTQSLKGPR